MSSNSGDQTVIVGAGPAGLTAALTLARYRHPTVLVDSYMTPRNGVASGVHGHIGLDGAAPTEIRARAWRELAGYAAVELIKTSAESVRTSDGDRFQVGLGNGEVIDATTVLLATGVADVHPAGVEGFSPCWGRTVIHCPLCLGEENAGRTWGHVTDNAQIAGLSAAALKAWTDDVVIICPETMPGLDETRATARSLDCEVITGTIRRLHHDDGSLRAVEFDDGRVIARETLVWTPQQEQVPVVRKAIDELGLNADDAGFLAVDDRQRTNVPGVFAAGDLASRWNQSFTLATSMGMTGAETIHAVSVFRALGMPMPDAPSYAE